MSQQTPNRVNSSKNNKSDGSKRRKVFAEDVSKENRREKVLRFLVERDMALPPTAIFGGLKRHYNIDFEYRTVQTSLKDLVKQGDVIRVDPSEIRDNANIVSVDNSSSRRAYYFPTEQGRERVSKTD